MSTKPTLTGASAPVRRLIPLPESKREPAHRRQLDQLMATRGRTFSFAARFLPAAKRADAVILYAFCRQMDDLVDERPPSRTEADVRREFDAWRAWLLGQRTASGPREPLAHELSAVLERNAIPVIHLLDLLDGLESDLDPLAFEEESELRRYCYRVASTVGLGMAHILGATSDDALAAATDLGAAMQRTNILRDVGEDLSYSRIYLPKNTLALFGLTQQSLRDLWSRAQGPDDRLRRLMRTEIAKSRDLYQRGLAGIWLLPSDCRLPILIAARLYRRILSVIERNDYDTLRRRAATTGREKLEEAAIALVVERLWRRGEPTGPVETTPSFPAVREA